ncbi:MAG TPA: TonB-dependent receptor plug domain-containing protein [Opitutaceae bacterium]|nr:TonB-dependent receptor plug domain-containing protein [Opitutaceae bacterium]
MNPNADQTTNADQSQAPIQLTPFEVSASQEHGYFSPTTLAGTRLNNNIADLPSSISIVTKQELLDTNSNNINDVFRYEANTEGASTYTPIQLVRGNVSDVLGQAPLVSGNRVRGLATADNEMDNYFALSRIPFDTYNTDSVEVDRGPNSILFGTGSPAGIVNQTRTKAVLDKFSGSVSAQVGSWGTFREFSGLNIPIFKDTLALYVGQMYQSQGFKQKPSFDVTRRQYAAFTLVPFKTHKTKISGSFEYYSESADLPNAVTPVDYITPWRNSGRPVYNPINNMVTYLDTGKTVGPYTLSNKSPDYNGILQTNLTTSSSPYFVPSLTYVNGGHNVQWVNPDGATTPYFRGQQTGFSVSGWVPSTLTPAQAMINEEKLTTSAPLPIPAGYQIWQAPTVSSKNVYDWSSINVDAMNNSQTKARIYYLDFQQALPFGFNFDAGWFRQELTQYTDMPVSQANATTLNVDTNQFYLDGKPNPHVGMPYTDTYASDIFESPEINNNLRASLEYEFNLANHVPGWARFLGHHRLMAVASQHDDVQQNLRYRESIVGGDPNYLPTAATLNQASGYGYPLHNTAIENWFFLGSPNQQGFGGSSPGNNGRPPIGSSISAPVETYNYATGQWQTTNIDMQSVLFPTGGFQENVQDSKTYFWQSFFWDNRIVGTMGLNEDWVKSRQNVFPSSTPEKYEYTNGFPNTQYWQHAGSWFYNAGKTRTKGVVVHPFKHWASIDQAADSGNLLAGFARTLSFTYNTSGNFNPPNAYYTDFFGNPLGKPSGRERDYGFEISTPDNKLFLRATWFKTSNINQLVGNTSNARALYIDATELRNWATAVVAIHDGQDPTDPNFLNTSVNPITPQMQQQISAITGLPYTFGGNVGEHGQFMNPYETQDGVAKGTELELTYNPTPNWRMKFSWGEQKTILSNIAAQAAAWIAHRSPVWTTYKSDLTQVYTRSSGRQMYLGDFWNGYGYDGNIYQGNVNGWNTTQDYYNIVVAGQLATDRALNGTQATNQRQYTWSYVSSYDFTEGALKGWTVGGALRYYGRAVAGYYGDTKNLSPSGLIYQPDVGRPIYTPRQYHADAWLAYAFRLPWRDGRIHGRVQLNVSDINIHNYLEPVTFNFDGTPSGYRIIQPRTYSLRTTFSF